jgi:kynurenine formamidase
MVIDCSHLSSGDLITREILQSSAPEIKANDFVLFHTGWSQLWGSPAYYSNFPVLNEESAKYLASFHLKGTGSDTISFDPSDSTDLPVHHTLLAKGMILIENLVNLERLPKSGFIFSCLPLKIKDGDGSPVRAVGIISSDK